MIILSLHDYLIIWKINITYASHLKSKQSNIFPESQYIWACETNTKFTSHPSYQHTFLPFLEVDNRQTATYKVSLYP